MPRTYIVQIYQNFLRNSHCLIISAVCPGMYPVTKPQRSSFKVPILMLYSAYTQTKKRIFNCYLRNVTPLVINFTKMSKIRIANWNSRFQTLPETKICLIFQFHHWTHSYIVHKWNRCEIFAKIWQYCSIDNNRRIYWEEILIIIKYNVFYLNFLIFIENEYLSI